MLRREASRFQCPNCGKSLRDCRVEVTAHTSQTTLVRITCANCGEAQIVAAALAAEVTPTQTAARDEPIDPSSPAVGVDEVLDARLCIRDHQGDLKSLIQPSTP